ncbi:MAG: ATP-binding protein [Eubacteriales bacterium]
MKDKIYYKLPDYEKVINIKMKGVGLMRKFVDRIDEMNTLQAEYNSPNSNFVVIYGRRRVGKTELISEFLRTHDNGLYFLATEESEQQNKKAFRDMVADFTGNELLKSADVDWISIFKQIVKFKQSEKKIIVIDEFQYIGISNGAFPSIIQKAWDTVMKDHRIMFIICGSYISLMKSQALDYGSPLYGRRTAQIKLKQIAFKHYNEFYEQKNSEELIPFYAVTGGVPKYIEMLSFHEEIYLAIEKSILNKQSFLYEEPYFLLQKEVSEIGSYFSLMKAIAFGNHKLSEISSEIGIKSTSITKYMKVLMDLDLIEREVPITEQNPEKSKSGLYKLTDNYIAFWFKFIYPYRSFLEKGETGFVLNKIKSGFVQNYVSYIYEDVTREKMWELNINGTWEFNFDKLGRYWGAKTGEVDIVAIDSIEKNLIVGECKYTKSEKGLDVLHSLQEKGKILMHMTKAKNVEYIIFSTGGFTKGLLDEATVNPKLKLISKL